MSEIEKLKKTIAAVEAQRASLGDAAVDAVLEGLRQQLIEAEAAPRQMQPQTAAQTAGGERRIVTVLVCDVKGSTALAEKLDPEAWTEIMGEAFDYLTEPVDRYGGTVAQLRGDGILALFGAPKTHEDDPQRAVLAGLAILENIQVFRSKLQQERDMNFAVRVGINTGLVVTQRIGSKGHEEYAALGDAVNLAQHMEETARPGSVRISEYTCRLVEKAFEFDDAGDIAVQGKSRRLKVYRVKGRRSEGEQERGHGVSSPFTGREREFPEALSAVRGLFQGRGGILYILGEAGIGKSRLISELQREMRQERLNWLSGRTLSFGQSISYWPFQEILRQCMGIEAEDSEADSWRKLESGVYRRFGDETRQILPYLGSLMTLEARGQYAERVKYLDGEAMRDQILIASRRFFEHLAAERPLVLVFEDLQWADASSVRLIERLLPLVDRARLLICGVSRPDPNPAAAQLHKMAVQDYAAYYTAITLNPLSSAESAQLLNALLASDERSAQARQLIVQKSDGNPFFIEEIMRDLEEEGALTRDTHSGRWRATARIETISIPDNIQGVIAARIDRLDSGVKRVLRAAAVIGQSFRLSVLRDVLQSVSGLNQSLAVLQSAELIAIKQRVPELVYIFKNSLARDVVYKRTLLQKRRALHAKTGQAIEALFADRLEEFYGLLAYHYAQAEAWGPAQDYLLKAGDQAGQVASGIEALNHYALALKAYENAFGQRWDTLQRATLARKMGDAHYGLGRMPESRDYYQDVLALLDKPLPGSRLGLFTGLIGQVFRQLLHRLWPARFIDLAAIEKRAALREVVNTYERLGVIFYIEGEAATSVYTFLRSLNLAEQNGSSPELARAYANNVIAASIIPPLRFMADRYSKLALEITRNIDDLATQAWVWELTGIFHVGMGRWKEAVHAEQQAAEINKRIGRLRWWEESIGVLSQTMHYRGQFASAREGYLELLASGQERGDRQTQVWGLAGLAESGLRLGVPGHQDEIITMLERAKALLDEYRFPNRPDEIQVYGLAAYVRLRRQEWALASQAAHRATGLINIEWPPSTFYTFESYAALPIVYLELWQAQLDGRFKPAKHENYHKLAQKAVRNLRNFARIFPMATPRAVLLQGLYEWCTERPERARALWQKSLDQAQRREMPFDVGLAHYEIGVHSPSESPAREEHLRRAVQIFTDLGAAWKLDQAQRALEN